MIVKNYLCNFFLRFQSKLKAQGAQNQQSDTSADFYCDVVEFSKATTRGVL